MGKPIILVDALRKRALTMEIDDIDDDGKALARLERRRQGDDKLAPPA